MKGPALPAEVTTTMPDSQACCTAWSSGLSEVDSQGTKPSDMFSTRMLSDLAFAMLQPTPAITVARFVEPLAPATFTETSPAPGASPVYWPPDELPDPAMRPATNVPCP